MFYEEKIKQWYYWVLCQTKKKQIYSLGFYCKLVCKTYFKNLLTPKKLWGSEAKYQYSEAIWGFMCQVDNKLNTYPKVIK